MPLLALTLLVGLLFSPARPADPPDRLVTTAEATNYEATTRYDDLMEFVRRVARAPHVHLSYFGSSFEGRDLPLVVTGADDATPERVLAAEKPRVLILGNIHAGEVAGKEAALMLIRELAAGDDRGWTDAAVLLFAPIFNADGNERIDPRNRPLQHGPVDGMGTRANAQGLDLNRDFEKLDSPEARALADLFQRYDPHVFVDLHTTNGTVHAYHLTYAPPLHPNTALQIDRFLRDEWLPALRLGMRGRGYETFLYGNDKPEWGLPRGWATFDPRPRFVTNYAGIRNRLSILSEAYSYATFEERVLSTKAFVEEILDFIRDRPAEIMSVVARAEASDIVGLRLPTRAAGNFVAEQTPGLILLGAVAEEANPHTGEPMWRRTDSHREVEMTMWQRFAGTDSTVVPAAYLIPVGLEDVVDRLQAHGIMLEPFSFDGEVVLEEFATEAVVVSERPFQGRHERQITGAYHRHTRNVLRGEYLALTMNQNLARLAFLLLEPTSDAGLASWGIVPVEAGSAYPVLRIPPETHP